mgnify:CR=1 FL=1
MIGVYGGFESIYDLNCIRLEKTDGDNYYISVAVYAYPDLAAQINPVKSDTPDFYAKKTYTVKDVDGVLQIQDSGIENPIHRSYFYYILLSFFSVVDIIFQ